MGDGWTRAIDNLNTKPGQPSNRAGDFTKGHKRPQIIKEKNYKQTNNQK